LSENATSPRLPESESGISATIAYDLKRHTNTSACRVALDRKRVQRFSPQAGQGPARPTN